MTTDIWTIKAALDWTEGYLGRKGDENPRLSAQWLMSQATGLSRIQLYAQFDRPLSLEERDVLRDYVARRGAGEPLQYITGEVGFRHITVKVRPGVLIPRPETEVLVSEALTLLPAAEKYNEFDEPAEGARELLVADICTGSGCIACSIAHEHPRAMVVATDIAPEAAALARENAEALGLAERISVFEGDLGACVPSELLGAIDLVVSNPPYIPTAVLSEIPREVTDYEPALALDGGADGLAVFYRLLEWCKVALTPGGAFAFELHETCLAAAASKAQQEGFGDVRVVEDLAGRPRVLTGRRSFS